MAFVNEKLTPTQREELAKKKIKNPYGSFRDTTEGIMPLYLTVDKNSETWLAHCYNHHDTNNDIEEFIFMYKSNPIPVQAIKSIHEKQVCWKITRIDFPKGLLNDKEHFQILLTGSTSRTSSPDSSAKSGLVSRKPSTCCSSGSFPANGS